MEFLSVGSFKMCARGHKGPENMASENFTDGNPLTTLQFFIVARGSL